MADDKKEAEDPRASDPTLNDDSQPSVTTPEEVLRQAAINAGAPQQAAVIPAPADAVDLAYRKAVADEDADEIGQAIADASSTEEAEDVVAKSGSPATRKGAKK